MTARTGLAEYCKLHGLNDRNFLSHSSRGCKSKFSLSAGLVPSEGLGEGSVLSLSVCLIDNLSSPSVFILCVCDSVQTSPLFMDINYIGLGSTLMTSYN